TAYGINSYYFAVPEDGQSFGTPTAAAMAMVAVQAYQTQHNGQDPTVQQVKRAMMSGVNYISGLNGRTITHNYVSGHRQDGGALDQDKIITAINTDAPALTGVALTRLGPTQQYGTTVNF